MSPHFQPFSSNENIPPRFWRKVKIVKDCWQWTGGTSDGYGMFWSAGRTQGAHRFIYIAIHGAIPAGHELDHVCNQRGCVNPAHLRSLPHRQNVIRRFTALESCPNGHAYTADNVRFSARLGGGFNRRCRTCHRIEERARYHRHKTADIRAAWRAGFYTSVESFNGELNPYPDEHVQHVEDAYISSLKT